MNKTTLQLCKTPLALMGVLTLISTAEAQFTYKNGDLLLGFRKTGTSQGLNCAVADLGAVTNYLAMAAGTSTNLSQYSVSQLTPDSFPNLTNLSWSVSGYVTSGNLFPSYPAYTLWVTVPRVNGVQSPAANRIDQATQQHGPATQILSIGSGAKILATTGGYPAPAKDNTATFLQEIYASSINQDYATYVEQDAADSTIGNLGGTAPQDVTGQVLNIEVTTPTPFSAAVQSDLYQLVPTVDNKGNLLTDPNSGQIGQTNNTGAFIVCPGYYVGYFQMNTDGTMTFTRASGSVVVSAPTAGFTLSATNGFAGLKMTFTDASTGSGITNWVWNFGNGTVITNTTSANTTATYATNGSYTVTLTVKNAGGVSSATATVVVKPTPTIGGFAPLPGGKLALSGFNCPAGVQYRILTSTNVALALTNWTPVWTNTFSASGGFAFTNATTNWSGYFRLVSP